jgi:hypothetical protein
MGDIFKEQLVKRKPSVQNRVLRFLLILTAGLATFLIVFLVPSFGIILAFAVCFGAYYALSYFNVEYEYVFTNGDLDIDIIYSKSRRKRVFSANVKQFDLMCHVDDTMRNGEFTSAQAILDYSGGTANENTYAFVTVYKGKRTKVTIEPNDNMLKAIASVMSRQKLFIKQ